MRRACVVLGLLLGLRGVAAHATTISMERYGSRATSDGRLEGAELPEQRWA